LNPAEAAAAEKVLETAMAAANMVQELVSGKTNWAKDDTKHTATTAAVAKEDASREEEEEEALSSYEDEEKDWGADHEKAKDAVKDITHKLNEDISLPIRRAPPPPSAAIFFLFHRRKCCVVN
jgi:hypothetical protein